MRRGSFDTGLVTSARDAQDDKIQRAVVNMLQGDPAGSKGLFLGEDYENPKEGETIVGSGGRTLETTEGYTLDKESGWSKFKNQITKNFGITFLGASIGRGASSTDERKRSFRRLLQESVNKSFQTDNVGYVRAMYTSRTINYKSHSGWNMSADKEVFGGGHMVSSGGSSSYIGGASWRYASITYEANAAGGTVTVKAGDTVIGTVDVSTGSGVTESAMFDSGTLATQDIKIETTDDNIRVYGFTLLSDTNLPSLDAYVCSGMGMADISDDIIDIYVDKGKPIINLVMSNDTDAGILYDKCKRLVERAAEKGLMVVLVNTIQVPTSSRDDNVRAYKRLASEYRNVIYMDVRDFIPGSHMLDWVHPNDYGHNDYALYVCSRLGIKLLTYSEMPY